MVFIGVVYYDRGNVSGIQRVAHNLENVSDFQSVTYNKKMETKERIGDISGNEKYLLFLQKK